MVQGRQCLESDERKMSASNKKIIEMQRSGGDDGELRYTQSRSTQRKNNFSQGFLKLLGIAFGAAVFLFLIVFFVYVIVPVIVILVLYSLIKRLFR